MPILKNSNCVRSVVNSQEKKIYSLIHHIHSDKLFSSFIKVIIIEKNTSLIKQLASWRIVIFFD